MAEPYVQPITPDEWRDALERFLHAYLLNNEPQVHPRWLAMAIWDWLRSQSPPYEVLLHQLEQAEQRVNVLRRWIGEEQADLILAESPPVGTEEER